MTLIPLLRQYLADHNVINLATTGDDGPWASAVFYVYSAGLFYFLSSPHTRHCRNLASDSRVAATIHDETEQWQDIKGVQLEGHATVVAADEVDTVIALYTNRFPVTGPDAPPEIARAIDKINWYQLKPTKLYFIDNAKGLGHRDEIDAVDLATASQASR